MISLHRWVRRYKGTWTELKLYSVPIQVFSLSTRNQSKNHVSVDQTGLVCITAHNWQSGQLGSFSSWWKVLNEKSIALIKGKVLNWMGLFRVDGKVLSVCCMGMPLWLNFSCLFIRLFVYLSDVLRDILFPLFFFNEFHYFTQKKKKTIKTV